MPFGKTLASEDTDLKVLMEAIAKMPGIAEPCNSTTLVDCSASSSDTQSDNPRVAQCSRAFTDAYNAAIKKGIHRFAATEEASNAYRRAMPSLFGEENIRDFIACVAHGILLQAIPEKDAGKLLYAAQVAHGSLKIPNVTNRPGRPKSPPDPLSGEN